MLVISSCVWEPSLQICLEGFKSVCLYNATNKTLDEGLCQRLLPAQRSLKSQFELLWDWQRKGSLDQICWLMFLGLSFLTPPTQLWSTFSFCSVSKHLRTQRYFLNMACQ